MHLRHFKCTAQTFSLCSSVTVLNESFTQRKLTEVKSSAYLRRRIVLCSFATSLTFWMFLILTWLHDIRTIICYCVSNPHPSTSARLVFNKRNFWLRFHSCHEKYGPGNCLGRYFPPFWKYPFKFQFKAAGNKSRKITPGKSGCMARRKKALRQVIKLRSSRLESRYQWECLQSLLSQLKVPAGVECDLSQGTLTSLKWLWVIFRETIEQACLFKQSLVVVFLSSWTLINKST